MDFDEEIKKDVEVLIQDLMDKEGIQEYELHFEGRSETGDNYAGEILFLKVVPKDGKEPYNLVAKTAKRAKELNKWIPIHKFYDREVFVYSKVFPTYQKLIKENCSNVPFDFVPKVYSISDAVGKQTIIFENLKSRGYKLHDRKKPWNLEHSLKTMKSYGKFHALSMALRYKKPEEFKELTRDMNDLSKEFSKDMDIKKFCSPTLDKINEILKKKGREDLVKKYDGFIDKIKDAVDSDLEDERDKIAIAHADCWNNNFMFRYEKEDETKPTSVCLLDFQLSLPRSPVKDLSYNIYGTCDKSTLDHFDELLETYHTSLSKCLIELGCNPDDVFSYETLKEQWKKYGSFGIVTSLFVLKICLVDKEDTLDFIDLSKKSESMKEFSDGMLIHLKNEEEFYRRILDGFIHFGDNFL